MNSINIKIMQTLICLCCSPLIFIAMYFDYFYKIPYFYFIAIVLIEAGVQIYLYEKGMVHAKVMIIDEEMAGVGSANYDMRSFRLNYEVIELLYSADVGRELTEQFERDLLDSLPLQMEELIQRSYPQRIIEQTARLFSPLL